MHGMVNITRRILRVCGKEKDGDVTECGNFHVTRNYSLLCFGVSIEHSALSATMKWTILSSEYLFNDLWFRRKDVYKNLRKIVDPYCI
jgi:hypothetical protein